MRVETRTTAEQEILNRTSPCGVYCRACPKLAERHSCRGCRIDSRHDRCDIYECCVTLGGKDFCFECECFPCERLRLFSLENEGMQCSHHRHIAIENLRLMREIGVARWIPLIEESAGRGEYTVGRTDRNGRPDQSPCPCKKTR